MYKLWNYQLPQVNKLTRQLIKKQCAALVSAVGTGKTVGMILKRKIEESLSASHYTDLSQLVIDVDSMYEYKNHKQATEMLTCGVLL